MGTRITHVSGGFMNKNVCVPIYSWISEELVKQNTNLAERVPIALRCSHQICQNYRENFCFISANRQLADIHIRRKVFELKLFGEESGMMPNSLFLFIQIVSRLKSSNQNVCWMRNECNCFICVCIREFNQPTDGYCCVSSILLFVTVLVVISPSSVDDWMLPLFYLALTAFISWKKCRSAEINRTKAPSISYRNLYSMEMRKKNVLRRFSSAPERASFQ